MGDDNVALMIGDLIGQIAQLELMAKYGIKPNTEFAKKVHEKYYKEATSPEKLEAQVEVNTQRDIDMKKLASKTPENYNKATFYNELVEKLDEQRKQEPEKPKRTWRNLIKLFHDDEPKRKFDGYAHNYRR
jgi:hypothetical protein